MLANLFEIFRQRSKAFVPPPRHEIVEQVAIWSDAQRQIGDAPNRVSQRSILEEVGYWDPKFYFDDYELWLRISAKYDLHHVNRVLVDKFVEEPPFAVRALRKGLKILSSGRTTPLK